MLQNFDAIIIGFGKGGKTLAGKLASAGNKVALVEKDAEMYGGTCINVGCIPSKSLVKNAKLAKYLTADFAERQRFYRKAIVEKTDLVAMLRQKNFAKLDSLANVAIFNGTASFLSPTTVKVSLAAGEQIVLAAAKIFINTGSTPVIPPIEGIKNNPIVYTSEKLLALSTLPRNLVIIGGGYIGLEFASIYADFGSKVTVIQDNEVFIPREDRDVAKAVQQALEHKGIDFNLGAKINKITDSTVEFTQGELAHSLQADAVLIATGRRPNTDELAVQNAGVELNGRGAVIVNEKLHTTAEHIWAMGDVTGDLQFTYTSLDDFRIVWSQLSGGDYSRTVRSAVPYSVFIDPPLSRVGLSENEATAAGYTVKIAELPAAAVPKAQVLGNIQGFLKAIIDAKTDKILGAVLFCEESHEMINLVKLAIDTGLPYQVLRDQIYTHPTMSESFNDLFNI